jgi:hypothetical protein
LQYWGRSNTHQHWFAIGLRFGQKFFNVAFCSYLHLRYFNWAAFPGGRISNPPTSQSPIVVRHLSGEFLQFYSKKYGLKILLQIFFLLAFINSYGQKDFNKYDSIIFKSLKRNIGHPYPDNDAKIGANFLKLTKTDSTINIESLFKTDSAFEITAFRSFRRRINEELNDKIKSPFVLVVPVYYFYDNETSFSRKTLKKIRKAKKKILKLGLHFSKKPFICFQPLIRIMKCP